VHAAGLTDELAERAWWAMPTAHNARRMLEKKAVVRGKTGPVLAEFLIEFLPFEEDPHVMIESVRLVLQPGLISDSDRQKLWDRARTKRNFYVGFMHALPDDLPEEMVAHSLYEDTCLKLQSLMDSGNRYALQLDRVLSGRGQGFLKTADVALKKPATQEVVESLLDAIAGYFNVLRLETFTAYDINIICAEAETACESSDGELCDVLSVTPELKSEIQAMLILSCLSVKLINPIFSQTDAIGTMMRKKIKPVTDPIIEQLHVLMSN